MKKYIGKISALFLVLCFCMTLCPLQVKAANYSYTITLHAGAKGVFADGTSIKVFEVAQGDTVSLGDEDVIVSDDKYYVQGITESGKEAIITGAVNAQKDMDFVVVYGIKGDLVAYTVQFLDANGNELAPAQTYYGNVGDKPVVSYLYFEDYQPQAYNLTKTLSANEAENLFPFVYTPVRGETVVNTQTVTTQTTTEGGEVVVETAAATATPAGAANAQDAANAADNAADAVTLEDVQIPLQNIDLDDVETPLSNIVLDEATSQVQYNLILLSVAAAAIVAGILCFVLLRRKRATVKKDK